MTMSKNESTVFVLANGRCHKALAIAEKVRDLGITPTIVDVDRPGSPAQRFGPLFSSGSPHAPAIVIGERAWRNPALGQVKNCLRVRNLFRHALYIIRNKAASCGICIRRTHSPVTLSG